MIEKVKSLFSKNDFLDNIFLVVGVTLLAAATTVFYEPNSMVTGGVSGLCILVASYAADAYGIDLPLGVLSILFNLPLLIIGLKVLGKDMIVRTIAATIYLSVALTLTSLVRKFHGDLVIVCVFGGVLSGVGVGLALRGRSTTGGSDLFGAIMNKKFRNISVPNAMFIFDALVIAAGMVRFGLEPGLYAILSVFIASKVVGYVVEGLDYSVLAYIISEKSETISSEILAVMERGVTGIRGQGMYTKTHKNVLMCVMPKKDVILLKKIVKHEDENAFIIVTDVREVLGEGFSHDLYV